MSIAETKIENIKALNQLLDKRAIVFLIQMKRNTRIS